MSVLSDKWIKKMVKSQKIISPFIPRQIRKGKISYGLSSYGYDARVSSDFKIFTNVNSTIVDPKILKRKVLLQEDLKFVLFRQILSL